MGGMSSQMVGGGGHGAGRGSSQGRGMVGDGLKMTPSNKRMHATRDTHHVITSKGVGGRVMRGVRPQKEDGVT